jgi:mono/diheme cytochrome c family protein
MPTFFSGEGSGPEDILGGDVARQMTALRDYVLSLGVSESAEAYGRAKRAHPEATVDLGRSLMVKLNCVGCHNVDRLPDGKRVAPSLAFQGSRVKPEWLVGFLRTPTDIKPEYTILGTGARMPGFRLSGDEVRALADYIMRTLVDPAPSGAPAPRLTAALVERGERLFEEKDCKSCHRIGGANAGGIGPILSAAESRLRPEWVARFIRNPDRFLPKTEMPNVGLTEEEAWALTAYLMNAK